MINEQSISNDFKFDEQDQTTDTSANSSATKQNKCPPRIKLTDTIQKFTDYFYRRQYFKSNAQMRKWALVELQKERVSNRISTEFSTGISKQTVSTSVLTTSKQVFAYDFSSLI
mgnify:CR=1 FL=1